MQPGRGPEGPLYPRTTCLLLVLGSASNERLLRVEGVLFLRILVTHILAVGLHVACFGLLSQIGLKDLIADQLNQGLVLHREVHLDSPIQVAWHEVRAAEIHLLFPTVVEIKDAAMLEEPPYYAGDLDIFADARQSWAQAADAAHQQVNFHSGLGRLVEQLDHSLVHQ